MSAARGTLQRQLAALARTRGLPIAVAAGLACGVFSGMFIVHRAHASPGHSGRVAPAPPSRSPQPSAGAKSAPSGGIATGAGTSQPSRRATAPAAAQDAGRPAVAHAGKSASGAGSATPAASATADAAPKTHPAAVATTGTAGSASSSAHGSHASAAPATATLHFDVRPPQATGLAISVDGKPISGTALTVTLDGGKKRVKVVARARGYLTWSHHVTVRHDETVRIHLRHPKPRSAGPGGLISL